MALASYRNVLRAIAVAFKGDTMMYNGARIQARSAYEQQRNLSDDKEIEEQIKHAQSVAKILRENVVQGQAVEGDPDRYKLRIHEDTERGDNETTKVAGQKLKAKRDNA